MSTPRVTVLYNEPTLPASHPDADSEHDILYTADVVAKALQEAGLTVSRLGLTHDPQALLDGLRTLAPDVIFNLYEGTAGWGNSEAYVCGILELLGIPFTGSPTKPLLLCRSKPLTKRLLVGAGLPTAPFLVVESDTIPVCQIPWPVIVKPAYEDASVGIEQKSVVNSQAELEDRVRYIRQKYGPSVLVERFIRGREFNVAIWERQGRLQTLPYSEILFVPPADAPSLWPIVSFDAKWRPGTLDFLATPAKNPADVTPELRDKIDSLAIQAFELVGCRDYARVDFRVDESGQPYILEVNPNPCISPLAGLAAGLETAKIPHHDFVVELVKAALRRGPRPDLAEWRSPSGVALNPHMPATHHAPHPNPELVIRQAESDDFDGLTELIHSLRVLSRDEKQTMIHRLSHILESGDARGNHVLLAKSLDDCQVGFVWIVASSDGQGVFHLEWIVMDASMTRHGVARRLLACAEQTASRHGGRIMLANVPSSAAYGPARQFFANQGYIPVGEIPEYYRDGIAKLIYVKHLPIPVSPAHQLVSETAATTS